MQETTIDFGIDLGTTNSVIAVMNAGQIEVIKNGHSEMTPSCAYINKKGVTQIGAAAKLRVGDMKSTNDVHFEVKRLMGQRVDLDFKSAGLTKSPDEVSAAVLMELRKAAEVRYGYSPRAAVITIPAMFETPQREATARAGKLAGFVHYELLQEPVAAAVAYGFRTEAEKEFWLVYDFGGGTFDAAIVSIRDGQLAVLDHDGDNYKGGSDFDWAIVEHVLIPQLKVQYDLSNLSRELMENDASVKAKMFILKLKAEELKVELSRSDEATITEYDVFQDNSGESVDLDVTLSRDRFNALISEDADQSIRIVENLLKRTKLKSSDIRKTILVGGSTFVPYIRDRVASLGIEVEHTIDPMTVVARGAAVYAASRRIPEKMGESTRKQGEAQLKLEYQPVSKEINPLVGGKVTLDNGDTHASETTIEIKRSDGGWSSGSIPLEAGGMFFTNLMVIENESCSFIVSVANPQVGTIPVSPNTFSITHGLTPASATLPNSIRLANSDGTTDLLLKKGTPLPATIDAYQMKTTKALRKGDATDELYIPFVEGDEELAERNRAGGRIIIRGDQVHRSLPENTELEISAEVDVSGVAHFEVFVPLLDDHFDLDSESAELKHEPPDVMHNRLRAAEARLQQLQETAYEVDDDSAQARCTALRSNDRIEAIQEDVSAWNGGDHSAAGRARNQQVALDKELDEIESLVEWPALLVEHQETLESARQIVHEDGDQEARNALAQLENEGILAIEDRDPKMLKANHDAIRGLKYSIVTEDPRFWVAMLQHVTESIETIPDQTKARNLLEEGMRSIKRSDLGTLQSIVNELLSMMPREEAERIKTIRSDVR